MDLYIRKMTEELLTVLNRFELPLEVKRLVLRDILETVARATEESINQEREKEEADAIHEN